MNPNKITLKKLKEISVPDFGDFVNHTKENPYNVCFEEINGQIITRKGQKKEYTGACAVFEHNGCQIKHIVFGKTPEDLKNQYNSIIKQEEEKMSNYLSTIKY
jgi:hypothetical protein